MVGDYGNARIFVHNTQSGIVTGVQNQYGLYISDGQIPLLNATEGLTIQVALTWSTRIFRADVVPAVGNVLVGFNFR